MASFIDIAATASPKAAPAERAAYAPSRLLVMTAVAGCAVLPVVISVFLLIGQSLRLDEAQSLWQTSRSVPAILHVVAGDVHVPLYHLLLHAWRLSVGDTVSAARALSLVFFILSVPMLYLLGARAYTRRIALFATLLYALSPFMNWYANEIRMYSLFALLTIASQYFFLRLMQEPRGRGAWLGYAATAVAGVFTDYFFFLNLATQGVFYAVRRARAPRGTFRRLVMTGVIVLASFAPWPWYVYHTGTIGFETPTLAVPSTVDLFNAFSQLLFGFQNDAVNTIVLSLWPVAIILGLLALRRNGHLSWQTQYFGLTILLSFAATFLGSLFLVPVFVSRYLIFTLPALYLVLASTLDSYARGLRYAGQMALAALMLAMLVVEAVSPSNPAKEDYAGAVGFLNAHVTAQDAVIVSAPFTIYPVQYYYRGPAVVSTLPAWNQYAFGPIPDFSARTLPAQAAKETANYQNVYLLLSYDQGYEKDIRTYFDSTYNRLYAKQFSNDLTLYVYRLRYNTDRSAIATKL